MKIKSDIDGGSVQVIDGHLEMTLRDYFAVSALPVARRQMLGYGIVPDRLSVDDIAGHSYAIADAMLKAREGSGDE